jgi:hypothetical protein
MRAKVAVFLVVLVALYDLSNAHAYLTTPPGWNTSPSTSPCKTFTASNTALATWRANERVEIVWTVIATDGEGDVSVYLDTTGGNFANFATSPGSYTQILSGGSSPSLGAHSMLLAIPDVNCTGGTTKAPLCTIWATQGNWQSCSTVAILPPCTTNCTDPPLPPPKCEQATGLTFCTSLNNHDVLVPTGFSAATIDQGTKLTYDSYLTNVKVFSNGGAQNCKSLYKTFLCALETPPCPGSDGVAVGAPCHKMCTDAMAACQLNETHTNLYPCSDFPLCPGESAAVAYAPLFAMIALFSLLAAFL